MYAPNISTSSFIKQTLVDIKDANTIIMSDFKTSLSPIDRPSSQKMIKETSELNDTIDQMDLNQHLQNITPNI
jgi:hypothetical protein